MSLVDATTPAGSLPTARRAPGEPLQTRVRRSMTFVLVASVLNLGAGSAIVGATEPPGKPAVVANPFAVHALAPNEQFSFEGQVDERLEAGPYLYQHVAGRWVVSLALTSPRDASRVRVTAVGQADRFQSPRLARTFDHLVFGMVRSVP